MLSRLRYISFTPLLSLYFAYITRTIYAISYAIIMMSHLHYFFWLRTLFCTPGLRHYAYYAITYCPSYYAVLPFFYWPDYCCQQLVYIAACFHTIIKYYADCFCCYFYMAVY